VTCVGGEDRKKTGTHGRPAGSGTRLDCGAPDGENSSIGNKKEEHGGGLREHRQKKKEKIGGSNIESVKKVKQSVLPSETKEKFRARS